nr:MAG TPA: hypothetical protein [Caudoviricetes sp.]
MIQSGVQGYVTGTATVTVNFPIDLHGNLDINCRQCWYFRRTYSTCGLNGQVCEYPDKYIGSRCPLKFGEEDDDGDL